MIESVSSPVKAENNPLVYADIFYRFFKILYRLDLFSIDFQDNVSFLKTYILAGLPSSTLMMTTPRFILLEIRYRAASWGVNS